MVSLREGLMLEGGGVVSLVGGGGENKFNVQTRPRVINGR